jgi:phage baseplate assembly protein W
MGSYSFKSSGKTPEQRSVESLIVSNTPIGIKTPLEINSSNASSILVMHDRLENVVHDNLRNLLLTNWGERLGLYKFGANLNPLLTDFVSQEDFDSEAIERIRNAVTSWMPYISLENFLSVVDRKNADQSIANISIIITYNVPDIEVFNKSLEILLKVI